MAMLFATRSVHELVFGYTFPIDLPLLNIKKELKVPGLHPATSYSSPEEEEDMLYPSAMRVGKNDPAAAYQIVSYQG